MSILLCLVWLIGSFADDRASLERFYHSTGGPFWFTNTNWLSGDPCENQWFGVQCENGDGRVTGLYMSGNNLTGSFPESFADLEMLNSFDLSENHLSGSLPQNLGRLVHLEAIGLRKNEMTGPLPESMASIPNLAFLHLDFNSFSGPFLPSFAELENLVVLGLTANNLNGTLPDYFGTFSKLTTLLLGGNSLSGSIPTTLKNLKSLTVLDLSKNHLSGSLPDIFGAMPGLTELDLFGNNLSGPLPPSLVRANGLVVFDAHANSLSGALPTWIPSAFPSLQYLRLQQNSFSGSIPPGFGASQVPPSVDLSGNAFSCPIPEWAAWTKATCKDKESPLHAPGPHRRLGRMPPANDYRVKVAFYGESKCPDMASLQQQFASVIDAVGAIMDLEVGFIAEWSSDYPTGFWSLHGQSEALGDMYELCALASAPLQTAMAYSLCMCRNQSTIPLPAVSCAKAVGLDPMALQKCAFGAGAALLADSAKRAEQARAVWSPTLFIDGRRACLWDLFPCDTPRGAPDIIAAICRAYAGPGPLPPACTQQPTR